MEALNAFNRLILLGSSSGEEIGIHGVAVKCVDIVRKTKGESRSLETY